jgi:rhodanese-related sulfurtransferase
MDLKAFQMLEYISTRLSNIEKNIARIDEKLDFSIQLQRNHLIRVKNGEDLDDSVILMGRPYNDLTPQQAFEIYQNPDQDFIIIDVSDAKFNPPAIIPGSVRIPYNELDRRYTEINSRTTPILLMSEEGLASIRAAELLVRKGFFNINNISGGHRFWPGHKKSSPLEQKPL